ncbi:peptidylprolyl isomerase [bacterium]|nr:peptidylprolyl isomerase [bacterium]|tara:strand:- start:6164 stop:6631 length:468 start_codon:yes stop_codon:yes gene_type:complete
MGFSHINIELEKGNVKIKLRPDLAPNHVERITELASEGFYDGVVFHRVIPNFMAQTGDPTGTGTGSSEKPNLNQEFSDENHVRGTASMARSADPNSANSQFFICFGDCSWLNGQYTVWGEVEEGMELIDQIKKGEDESGVVQNPDKMIKVVPVEG